MTRRVLVYEDNGKFYISQEFNGDKKEALSWNKKCKFYYNGSGEQQTIEYPDGKVEYIASRPNNFEMAILVVKTYWQDLVLA